MFQNRGKNATTVSYKIFFKYWKEKKFFLKNNELFIFQFIWLKVNDPINKIKFMNSENNS